MSNHTKGCVPPAARPAWQKLQQHQQTMNDRHLRELFAGDPDRAERYSIQLDGLYVDYSKHLITDETLGLLFNLATESELHTCIEHLFSGEKINTSEQRPALHTALRKPRGKSVVADGKDVSTLIHNELDRMNNFVTQLHAGNIKGHTGKSINTLVNIGIGGSDLGPRLACEALRNYHHPDLNIHFVANIDPHELDAVLGRVAPERTLFVVSSKSFNTRETLTNAMTVKRWLTSMGCHDISRHFAAVTSSVTAAENFGITPEFVFRIWNWVGGRYSVWSAVGLPVAAAVGMDNFRALLAGAYLMDEHFCTAPLEQNIPAVLGLLDIWYINFFDAATLAFIPYDQRLDRLPDYLAQLFMESNGKRVNQQHMPVDYSTGAIVWGGVGTNAQHAFMQLLHQGTRLIPADLLAAASGDDGENIEHRELLLANCIAQGEALMTGNTAQNSSVSAPFKTIPGNKPSTTLIYEQLTPRTLGMLLALYEHRTFVQAAIWDINPFDQWGVELGKQIASNIKNELTGQNTNIVHDTSTRRLIEHYLNYKNK